MKRYVFVVVLTASLIAAAGPALAAEEKGAGITIDGSLILATEPVGGYDSTVGIGVGALIDLSKQMGTSRKDMKIGIRGDLSYFDFDGSYYGVGVSYTRLVLFGGPRITFIPGNDKVQPYVEGGLELAYDDVGTYAPGFGSSSATDINLGIAGGGGVDFLLAPNVKLGVNGRLHIISDSFLSLGVTLGFMF